MGLTTFHGVSMTFQRISEYFQSVSDALQARFRVSLAACLGVFSGFQGRFRGGVLEGVMGRYRSLGDFRDV